MVRKRTIEALRKRCGLKPGAKLLVACSGGLDSVCLLRTVAASEFGRKKAPVAGHVDHGLRPESESEGKFVKGLAESLECSFASRRLDPGRIPKGASLEAAMRTGRRAALLDMARKADCEAVLLAHHADDQVETVLMRLFTGCGLSGLTGMAWRDGPFARPMLAVRRAELLELAARRGWEWREDPSNARMDHLRNRLRHKVLPDLEAALGRGVAAPVLRFVELLRADRDLLESEADRGAESAVVRPGPGRVSIDRGKFLQIPEPLAGRILSRSIYEALGGPSASGDLHAPPDRVGSDLIGDLMDSIRKGPGGSVDFLSGLRMKVDRAEVSIERVGRREGNPSEDAFASRLLPKQGRVEIPEIGAALTVRRGRVDLSKARANADPDVAYLDAEKTGSGLRVRPWRRGDRFYPLGGPGEKKLSDFFVDCKVSRGDKRRIPIVAARDGIVWVAGRRIDRRFRLTEKSRAQTVLRLERLEKG